MTAVEEEGTRASISAETAVATTPHGGRLSDILSTVASDNSRDRISIADLFEILRHRAFGALMLIFAAPNALPTPPGFSSLFAAPLLFLAAQLALGRPAPWLPRLIAARSISRSDFASILEKASPWLIRSEKMLKPRLSNLTRPPFEQAIAVVCLLLAVVLFLPIPLGNMLPAIAICIFSLAILERDGIAAMLGVIVAAVSVAVVWGVLYTLFLSAIFLIRNAFAN